MGKKQNKIRGFSCVLVSVRNFWRCLRSPHGFHISFFWLFLGNISKLPKDLTFFTMLPLNKYGFTTVTLDVLVSILSESLLVPFGLIPLNFWQHYFPLWTGSAEAKVWASFVPYQIYTLRFSLEINSSYFISC